MLNSQGLHCGFGRLSRRLFNPYRNQRAAQADLIAFLEFVSPHLQGKGLHRRLTFLAPANAVAVKKCTVPAAQVPNVDVGRVDVQQAMPPGHFELRNLEETIFTATHGAHRPVLKDEILIKADSVLDMENNFSGHVPPLPSCFKHNLQILEPRSKEARHVPKEGFVETQELACCEIVKLDCDVCGCSMSFV
jgi:hypothetical protein